MDDDKSHKTKRTGKKIGKAARPPKPKHKKDAHKQRIKHSP